MVTQSDRMHTLCSQNMGLVEHIARETVLRLPDTVCVDDLISAGTLALVQSAGNYDESLGVPFGSWAAIRIRGALLDELRSMDWASRSVRSKAREVEAARNQLAVTLGRSPRLQEVADTLGVSVPELQAIDADVRQASVLRLQGFAPDVQAYLVLDRGRSPEQLLLDREQWGYLHDAIAELPERLRYVIQGCFFDGRQIADLAAELGVTESRISQLRKEAFKLLRHGLASAWAVEPPAKTPGAAAARAASYAAAVAARGTLSTRLEMTNVLGEMRQHRSA